MGRAPKTRGIECPKCGCRDLRVNGTVRQVNFITRYRVCRNCGTKLRTREFIEKAEQKPRLW